MKMVARRLVRMTDKIRAYLKSEADALNAGGFRTLVRLVLLRNNLLSIRNQFEMSSRITTVMIPGGIRKWRFKPT